MEKESMYVYGPPLPSTAHLNMVDIHFAPGQLAAGHFTPGKLGAEWAN